jgi:hypothetical protein
MSDMATRGHVSQFSQAAPMRAPHEQAMSPAARSVLMWARHWTSDPKPRRCLCAVRPIDMMRHLPASHAADATARGSPRACSRSPSPRADRGGPRRRVPTHAPVPAVLVGMDTPRVIPGLLESAARPLACGQADVTFSHRGTAISGRSACAGPGCASPDAGTRRCRHSGVEPEVLRSRTGCHRVGTLTLRNLP